MAEAAVRERAASGRTSAAARARSRGLRFTREGRVFVLVTLGVGAAAVNSGNNLLYLVLGLMLSLILVSGVLSDLVLLRIAGQRVLPTRAFAGSQALVEIALVNEKERLPSFSLEVEDRAPDEPTDRRCYFLKVEAAGEQRASYRRELRQRGVLRFESLRVSTRYPFGLFDKWRILEAPAELLVFPRIDRSVRSPVLAASGVGTPDRAVRGPGIEPASLRDYRVGDEARSLHGRRSAALGRLVVREREREASRSIVIAFDDALGAAPDVALSEAFERAISRVAGLAAAAQEDGASVVVVGRRGRSPLVTPGASLDPVLAWLARLTPLPIDPSTPFDVARADVVVTAERGASA